MIYPRGDLAWVAERSYRRVVASESSASTWSLGVINVPNNLKQKYSCIHLGRYPINMDPKCRLYSMQIWIEWGKSNEWSNLAVIVVYYLLSVINTHFLKMFIYTFSYIFMLNKKRYWSLCSIVANKFITYLRYKNRVSSIDIFIRNVKNMKNKIQFNSRFITYSCRFWRAL